MSAAQGLKTRARFWMSTLGVLVFLTCPSSCIHLGWVKLQCTQEHEALQFFPHARELQWMYLANFNTVLSLEIYDRSRPEHAPPPLTYQDVE